MAYLAPTPKLGLVLPDPASIQAFETANVNSNFTLIDTGVGADRTRLAALEGKTASRICRLGGTWSSTWSELFIGGAGLAFTEISDAQGWHDPVTNPDRITPNIPGLYRITLNGAISVAQSFLRIYFNGAGTSLGGSGATSLGGGLIYGGAVMSFNGTTDYIRISLYGGGYVGSATVAFTVEYIGPDL